MGEIDPTWRSRLRRISSTLSVGIAALGLTGVAGRVFGEPILAQWVNRPDVRPMQPISAIVFVFVGAAVMAGLRTEPKGLRLLGQVLGAIVAIIGGVIVYANIVDLRFPIVLLNGVEMEDVLGGERPARPALNEGVCLLMLGVSMVALSLRRRKAHILGHLVALLAAMIAATVIVAFAYGDESLRGFPLGSGRMPISVAVLIVLSSLAVVAARPSLGLMPIIVSPWPGGIVLRRLLPLVVLGPPAAVAFVLGASTPESQPRWFAVGAVIASGLFVAALFATAAAVSGAARSSEIASDVSTRAAEAVNRDAAVVGALLSRLTTQLDQVEGMEAVIRFRPAEGWLAGDAVLTVAVDENRMAAALIDAVGHGPEPALAAARLAGSIKQALLSGFGPAEAINQASWVLDRPELMATAAVVEIDVESGHGRYSSAASPPLLIRSDRGIDQLPATGPVLLPGEHPRRIEQTFELAPGDTLFMFSDGFADPACPEGVEVASVPDLVAAIDRCPYRELDDLADWCLDEAVGQAGGASRDDASLVALRRLG